MKFFEVIFLLLMIILVNNAGENGPQCNQGCKIIEYGSNLCNICYTQCSQNSYPLINNCMGLKCKISLANECYYYSYQYYDQNTCMGECCGLKKPSNAIYSTQQISTCLLLNVNMNASLAQGSSNRLAIILGSITAIIFIAIVTVCICCRRKIKNCFRPHQLVQQPPPENIGMFSNSFNMIKRSDIKYILEQSDQHIQYLQQEQCTICLNEVTNLKTSCGHWFHLKCLSTWLAKNYKCPNCNNEEVNPITVLCRLCRKPYVEIQMKSQNEWKTIKRSINFLICKSCNQR